MKKKPGEQNDLYYTLMDNRHLKDTIAAMREELEAMRQSREESVQRVTAEANAEILQLKSAIVALREELERMRYEKEESVREVFALMNSETLELKILAGELRLEMERRVFALEEQIVQERLIYRDESRQLQQTIMVLREALKDKPEEAGTL